MVQKHQRMIQERVDLHLSMLLKSIHQYQCWQEFYQNKELEMISLFNKSINDLGASVYFLTISSLDYQLSEVRRKLLAMIDKKFENWYRIHRNYLGIQQAQMVC
jgi:hypothetical protein